MDEVTKHYWESEASTFDDSADHGLRDPAVRAAWDALLTLHLPDSPVDVVDLGCGTGSLSVLLAHRGHRVRGLDLAAGMVERARSKARAAGVDVTFETGDAAAPPFGPASCDVVLCRHVLWAMPDPADALCRWVALLRPGGRLLLVEGSWSTGAGLRASETVALVEGRGRRAELHRLTDPALWGREIDDERYLVVSAA